MLPQGASCPEFVSLQEWNPHYFVLTSSKIYYSGETTSDQGNEDEEEQKEVRAPLRDGKLFPWGKDLAAQGAEHLHCQLQRERLWWERWEPVQKATDPG